MTIDPKYPIGKFEPKPFSDEQKKQWLSDLQLLPEAIEKAITNLDESQINTPYREGGWSVKQVVHHVADSHMNALIRFKLTITEEHPTIKPYMEAKWAELSDVKDVDPGVSINLLQGIHLKLVSILRNASKSDFDRVYFHPESQKEFKLSTATALYSWHGKHHLGHLRIINSQKTTI